MRKRIQFQVSFQSVAQQTYSPAITSIRLIRRTNYGKEMGFGTAIQYPFAVASGFPGESGFKALLNEALS